MSLEDHIKEIMVKCEYKYFESAEGNEEATTFFIPFTQEDETKLEIYVAVNNKYKYLKIYNNDFIDVKKYNKNKLASHLMELNKTIVYGSFSKDRDANNITFTIAHSLEGEIEKYNEIINMSQFKDYLEYIFLVRKNISIIIERDLIKKEDGYERGE